MTLSFTGPAKRLDDLDLPRIGAMIGVGEDEIHAFIEVETRGGGFDAQGRPRILFEPHVFYRNLPAGTLRAQAVRAGLACERWGQIAYGKESEQYPKLLRALLIDETAALKACSWGLGQVLGENHVAAGHETVQAMVADFTLDEDNHLEAAIRFIKANGLDDELRRHDWAAFARGYNGPGYRKNGYDTKLAAAFAKWRRIKDTPWSPGDPPIATSVAPPSVAVDRGGSAAIGKPVEASAAAAPGFLARLVAGFRAALGA
ncbi:MAG: hypothetical protein DI537_08820 [Stutzerimonas stutzeri]|nr:MAG: hypothetical protein DI537_08820 [Stutzerimonas stutzeri]